MGQSATRLEDEELEGEGPTGSELYGNPAGQVGDGDVDDTDDDESVGPDCARHSN